MDLFFRIAFGCAWGALVLVWAWGWRISKPTSRTAEDLNSLTPYLPVLIGVVLLQVHVLPESWTKEPLWPHSLALDAAGLAVTVLGAVFAIWSRMTLGRNWSSVPQVKEQHELVVKGPDEDRLGPSPADGDGTAVLCALVLGCGTRDDLVVWKAQAQRYRWWRNFS